MKKLFFILTIIGVLGIMSNASATAGQLFRITPKWPCNYVNGVATSECSLWYKIGEISNIETSPIFKHQENLADVPWDATYDWEILQDGDYAVEVSIKNGIVDRWKLVERNSGMIITLAKVKPNEIPANEMSSAGLPSDDMILKKTFVENWQSAEGNFYKVLEVKDKIIYLYTK